MPQEKLKALILCALSFANYGLLYGTSILLARTLDAREFDDYNVAVSSVFMLVSFTTLGLEKFALRCLPAFREKEDWARSQGYLSFSRRMVFWVSFAAFVVLAVGLESTLALQGKDFHLAIVLAIMFLPIVASFQFDLEVSTAYGGQLPAVATYRLLVPLLILGLNVGAFIWREGEYNAITAVVCYGSAWFIGLFVLRVVSSRHVPSSIPAAIGQREPMSWLRGAMPLVASSFILTTFAQSGVIILELIHSSPIVVSGYAVAFQTGTFVVLIATATNRLYLPRISELLAKGDSQALAATARRRLQWIAVLIAINFLVVVFAGRSILAIFGNEFIPVYPALVVITLGASVSTLFSLSPAYLQYTDRNQLVIAMMAGCAVLNLVMCFSLGRYYGAMGAAIAYAVPISILYTALRIFAVRDLNDTLPRAPMD